MDLQILWFILIAVLWAGYFLLEGFDFGVGMLLPFLPRDEERARRRCSSTIGPVWDGNEVWLVVAGGATFAAFPAWYATMFSGFYIALLLVLFFLIVRVVSFEWRAKSESPRWQSRLDVGEHGRQLRRLAHLGRRARQPPLRRPDRLERRLHRRLLAISSAATRSLAGLAVVLLFAFHGATFLTLRTTGDLLRAGEPRRAAALRSRGAAVGRGLPRLDGRRSRSTGTTRTSSRPILPAALGIAALAPRGRLRLPRQERLGIRDDRAGTVLAVATLFTSLYPRVMVSSTDFAQQPHGRQRVLRALHARR